MTLLAVTTAVPSASDPSDRSAAASARGNPEGGAFSQTLSKLTPAPSVVTVQPGDTLSALVQKRLQETNSPMQLSADQLYRVALKVAADQGIANANLIYPDQRIDLGSVESMAMAEALQTDGPGTPWAGDMPARSAPASRVVMAPDGAAALGPKAFLAQHAQAARQAQAHSGIPATFMVAQAALETGWGKHEIRFEDGRTSHNLFGIKASANWKGPVAEIWTTEFVNGSAQKVRAQFRAYASYEESFNDYARLISQNPRYANAMRHLGDPQAFAAALQQAGYATAPHYAQALTAVIQTAQRLQGSTPTTAAATAPSTMQMLSLRGALGPGGDTASGLSALNTLPGSTGAQVASRQWRQSPYADLNLPQWTP